MRLAPIRSAICAMAAATLTPGFFDPEAAVAPAWLPPAAAAPLALALALALAAALPAGNKKAAVVSDVKKGERQGGAWAMH